MTKIVENSLNYRALSKEIRSKAAGFSTLEEFAQLFMESIYKKYSDSIVISRLFVTVPYKQLPKENQYFVEKLTKARNVNNLLKEDTLVLSLIGSSGLEKHWNNRSFSRNHVGIPLLSSDFIDEIPMMSRLLKQLGLNLNWINQNDTDLVKHTMGSLNGMFFVEDATTEKDQKGRLIIAAQDFVKNYQVKTVFGFGGSYIASNTFFTSIIFLREKIKQQEARIFTAEMSFFKAMTANFKNNIFKN